MDPEEIQTAFASASLTDEYAYTDKRGKRWIIVPVPDPGDASGNVAAMEWVGKSDAYPAGTERKGIGRDGVIAAIDHFVATWSTSAPPATTGTSIDKPAQTAPVKKTDNTALYLGIGVLALLIVGAIAYAFTRRKRRRRKG